MSKKRDEAVKILTHISTLWAKSQGVTITAESRERALARIQQDVEALVDMIVELAAEQVMMTHMEEEVEDAKPTRKRSS